MDGTREEILRQNGMLDDLTGIYNRQGFYQYTREMLNKHQDLQFCLVYLNIRKFKVINNLFGRDIGDKMLIRVADALRKEFGGNIATYGRLERDNFVCCVQEEVLRGEDWMKLGEISYFSDGSEYHFFSCYGLYKIEDVQLNVSNMVDKARVAMETVKDNYMVPYVWYDESMWGSIVEEQKLNSDFKQAIAEKQFKVYYQPICRAEDGVVTGAEALVRWVHPERGLISPGEFIPVFEKNGFINILDRYVWEEVCGMLKARIQKGVKVVPVSINVSRVEFYNYYLAEDIYGIVKKYDLPVELLKVELTETAYSENPKQVLETIKKLREYGFVLLMDDFGSGYSSLNILKDLPIDILKIDMKFLTDFEQSEKAAIILEIIVRMAKWMKFRSVAEGVETKKEWDFLKSVECDLVQGYYFYRPMPEQDFEELLNKAGEEIVLPKEQELPEYDDILRDAFKHGDSRESTLFYSMLGGMGVFEMTEDGLEIVQVNKGYYEVMKIKGDTPSGETKVIHKQVREPSRSILMEQCRLSRESNAVQQIQMQHKKDDDTYVWLNVKVRYLGSRGKRSLYYFALDNIDDIKKAEQERYLSAYSEALIHVFDKVYNLDYSTGMAEVLHTAGGDKMKVGEKYYFLDFFERFSSDIEAMTGKRAGEIVSNKELLDQELAVSKNGSFSVGYQIINPEVGVREVSALFFKVQSQPDHTDYLCCIKRTYCENK